MMIWHWLELAEGLGGRLGPSGVQLALFLPQIRKGCSRFRNFLLFLIKGGLPLGAKSKLYPVCIVLHYLEVRFGSVKKDSTYGLLKIDVETNKIMKMKKVHNWL